LIANTALARISGALSLNISYRSILEL